MTIIRCRLASAPQRRKLPTAGRTTMRTSACIFFAGGQCRAALEYYARALGGQGPVLMRYADSPMGSEVPADWQERIGHGEVEHPGGVVMGSDGRPGFAEPVSGFAAMVEVPTTVEAERVFQALGEGGSVLMPLAETFWAERFGMLADRFGVRWMVGCAKPS
jgi:PhnB protein